MTNNRFTRAAILPFGRSFSEHALGRLFRTMLVTKLGREPLTNHPMPITAARSVGVY